MDVQQFLADFGHIADAPNGVAQLRQLILQLAITGRLVERIESDTPVADSLRAAARARQEYEKKHSLRPPAALPPAAHEPFAVPEHWRWTQLDRLCVYVQRGKSPAYAPRGSVRVISQKSVQWTGFSTASARFIGEESLKGYGSERFLCEGDLLWNSTGTGTVGRVALYDGSGDGPLVADSHVTVIRLANTVPGYAWCVLASPWVQVRFDPFHPSSLVSGSTQQVELATKSVRRLGIPLPPVEEQARIVDKVDLLMAMCNDLEAQQQTREKHRDRLCIAVTEDIYTSKEGPELYSSCTRLLATIGDLASTERRVAQIEDVLQYLDLRGSFSTQPKTDDADDTASLPLLPNGWRWDTLGSVCEYITSGSRGWSAFLADDGDIFVRSQDIKTDTLVLSQPAFVNLPAKVEGKRTLLQEHDVLLTITGGNVGRCALVPDLPKNAYVSQHVALIRPKDPELSEIIHAWMVNGFGGRRFLAQYIYGDKPGLNLNQVRSVPIPVPPTAERAPLISALRARRATFAGLTTNVTSAQKVAAALAKAAVFSLTGIDTTQDDEAVKAPETQLVAPVRLAKAPEVKDQAPLAALLARHQGEMSARDLWQRFSGDIDAFYSQLKTEIESGWIAEPKPAEMLEISRDREAA